LSLLCADQVSILFHERFNINQHIRLFSHLRNYPVHQVGLLILFDTRCKFRYLILMLFAFHINLLFCEVKHRLWLILSSSSHQRLNFPRASIIRVSLSSLNQTNQLAITFP
jgi:hypothetical protein